MINIRFSPFPVLTTERLILREINCDDIEEMYELLSNPNVAEYEYFYPVKDKNEAMSFIERYKKEIDSEDEITWGITDISNNELLGTVCLGDFSKGSQRCEIGYSIRENKWNKGYATEAVRAIIKYGFVEMGLNRIEATITPGNDASTKVLEKVGFLREGLVRERDLIKGKLEDGIIMAMLKKEYRVIEE